MKPLFTISLVAALCAAPASAEDSAPLVKLYTVPAAAETEQRVFFGRVVARETVEMALQVGGQIIEFPVEEGALVRAGDLIARMDQEPFDLALARAQAQRAEADRRVERFRELRGSTVSETSLEDAETAAELAALAVRNAERDLRNATLRAPFDGIVAARIVATYATVAAGTPVVRLHDMSDLRIEIDVPETLVNRVGRDASAEVRVQFPFDARSFPVALREFNAETAPTGQTYSITVGTAPPEGLTVLPGASARVTARFATNAAGLSVPGSAVFVANDGSAQVMVFAPTGAETGTLRRTPVTIAPDDSGAVTVLSGLAPGQQIVAIGGATLPDGASVRRFTGFEG